MKEKSYECPFCHSHISKEKYEKVIKENRLLKEKLNQLEVENRKNIEKNEENKKRFDEERKKFKEERQRHKEELKGIEKSVKSKEKKKYASAIQNLKLKIKNLEEGKTAQEVGFDYEKELFGIIKDEFKSDEVSPTGKMGDVIIKIRSRGKTIGTLLVEIKKVEKHSSAHVEEVKRHKIDANADVGILVTNGDFGKTKMDGFKNIGNVLIIRPNSAIDFLKLLRKHLVDIDHLKLTFAERENERVKLWEFIHSPEFETQMDSILRDINQFKKLDGKESKILEKRSEIEESLLRAYNIITEGIKNTKKNN